MKEKELWQYFFNKPKKNYNKYMFEMPNYPNHLIYDSEIILSTKGIGVKIYLKILMIFI